MAEFRKNPRSKSTADSILECVVISLDTLSVSNRVKLTSSVSGKNYLAFASSAKPDALTRPVNIALFNPDRAQVSTQWTRLTSGRFGFDGLASLCYTMVTAPCVASDLQDRNNKKGPATYFENFVGHLFATVLGVNPKKTTTLPIEGGRAKARLTMDFLFEREGRPSIHLPVKMSTRERVVQAWAHQRILDRAFGEGQYRGILVVHSETKLDLLKRDVTEICVPDQWLAYQTLLSRMERIYYFDTPERYAQLAKDFPVIPLKPFAEFFTEITKV
jgi:hypothetical protein